jgi:NAD(P)-dependent dehydrogenase (short-subunit alcohol dehydrogenase family)
METVVATSKTVLITGANRGIGLQIAKELAKQGFRVFLGARDQASLGQALASINIERPAPESVTIDVSDSSSILRAAADLTQRIDRLDVLVNNAGIYPDKDRTILDISRDQLLQTFDTNTFGPIEVVQAFLPLLRKSGSARVINVSSGYGQLDGLSPDVPSYCLSKLALNGVTLMLAEKLRSEHIAVNSVCPGWVRTDMGGSNATRSVEEGAAGTVWLAADAPHEFTGRFFRDGEEIAW